MRFPLGAVLLFVVLVIVTGPFVLIAWGLNPNQAQPRLSREQAATAPSCLSKPILCPVTDFTRFDGVHFGVLADFMSSARKQTAKEV